MLNVVTDVEPSYKLPSPFQLRKRYLNQEVKYVVDEILLIREKWKVHGCTMWIQVDNVNQENIFLTF